MSLPTIRPNIPAMTPEAIEKVRALEQINGELPQLPLHTTHIKHAGLYSRTIKQPAYSLLTGALLTKATQLIVCGHCLVFIGDETVELEGYHVLTASAGRKQAFYTLTDTWLTMCYATDLTDIDEIENDYTDEAARMVSRRDPDSNTIIITGE